MAIIDEFLTGLGLPSQFKRLFPPPGSGRGIPAADYIRTLIYHFADGGRYLEEMNDLKGDKGFRSLIRMHPMPGADAVGNWLRRWGVGAGPALVRQVNDGVTRRYFQVSDRTDFVLDVDGTLIESNKGDATYSYKGQRAYHPMLGFVSDGTNQPVCSYVRFRPGHASAQTDILEALKHTLPLVPAGKRIQAFRSDSAAYQAQILDFCHDQELYYTITADLDASVRAAIRSIPSRAWAPLHDGQDGFNTGREVAEVPHTLTHTHSTFRLIVHRERKQRPDLFGAYHYYALITSFPEEGPHSKTAEEAVWFHQDRGNAERFIGDTKYGVNLRYLPCGQLAANALYYTVGIFTFNVLKLMQMTVLPAAWTNRTVLGLRTRFFRWVAKVTYSGHQWIMQVDLSLKRIREIIRVRDNIWAMRLAYSDG